MFMCSVTRIQILGIEIAFFTYNLSINKFQSPI